MVVTGILLFSIGIYSNKLIHVIKVVSDILMNKRSPAASVMNVSK